MNLRAFSAIVLCKGLRLFARIVNRGGTALPGRLALKLCPGLLSILAKDVKTVAITGTNGKTTSSRMMEEAFKAKGYSYFANRSGANLLSGITTEFVMNSTLTGRMKREYAIIECDEAAAVNTFPQLRPQLVVVTNLFRDQQDRYGDVTNTLGLIRTALSAVPDATLCLNADCSLTASLAGDLPNRVVWFGVDAGAVPSREKPAVSDATYCIRCKAEYEYDYISYAHLGGFRCPTCGYARHRSDFGVTKVLELSSSNSVALLRFGERELPAIINLPAMYNIYNAVGTAAALCTLHFSPEEAISALGNFKCGFGRMEQFDGLGVQGAKMILVKNPVGCNQVLEFLEIIKKPFALAVCLNGRVADGRDVSWIWDVNFEILARLGDRLVSVIASGDRARAMRVRLKRAGIPETRITVERDYSALVEWAAAQQVPVYFMPTYTAMLELRKAVVSKTRDRGAFWEG